LPFDLIDRLERLAVDNFRSIDARGSEIGGLLFGSADPAAPSTLWIEDFEQIPCDYSRGPLYRLSEADLARFDAEVQRRDGAPGQRAAGFFRSHSRKGLALDAEDMAVIEARFRDPLQIALLVRPFATKVSAAGIFIWEDGRMHGEASYLEFPFRSSELPATEGRRDLAAPPAGNTVEPPPGPRPVMRAPVVAMPSRLKIARPSASAMVVTPLVEPAAEVSALAAPPPLPPPVVNPPSAPPAVKTEEPASVVVSRPAVRLDPPKLAEPAPLPRPAEPIPEPVAMETEAPAAPTAKLLRGKLRWLAVAGLLAACSGALFIYYPGLTRHAATRPPAALTLRVEHTATDLLLTWNQDSDAVRNARRAVLSISDGDRQENLDLNLSDLRNGSIVYSPLSADVSFRMEVIGSDQSKTASESVRVLRTKPSPMPPADAPAAARTQPNSSPQSPGAPSPSAAAEQQAAADAPSVTPAPRPAPTRTFSMANVPTLAQRLRPATPTDLPDAPDAGAAAGAAGLVNFGALSPAQVSMPAATSAPADAKAAAAPSEIRQPQLTSLVKPEYPDIARRQGISGVVSLSVIIGANGRIKTVKALSGPELLRRPAMDAVKQWVYSPATVNGRPVDSEKQLDVTFSLPR